LVDVADATFHFETSALNLDQHAFPVKLSRAPNVSVNSDTEATFHVDKSPVKLSAHANVRYMLVTAAVFHLLMSSSNDFLASKIEAILVTALVSQLSIAKYFSFATDGLVIHSVTAAAMLESVILIVVGAGVGATGVGADVGAGVGVEVGTGVGVTLGVGVAMHVMMPELPDKTPYQQINSPDTVYPSLHDGVHELPLARLEVHPPSAPLVGGVTAHGLALHAAVFVVSAPKLQVRVPDVVYPLLHVGVHELPLARLDVHGVASPFVGAVAASHGLGLQRTASKTDRTA
jgi:hypothetical protein